MVITLSEDYNAYCDTELLGYVGEHRARTIEFVFLEVEGADLYKMRFEYTDRASYEVDITSGRYVIDGSVLRYPQKVMCQIYALSSNDDSYELVKKSQIFELSIRAALTGEPEPIPTYEAAKALTDRLIELGIISEETEVIDENQIREIWEELQL